MTFSQYAGISIVPTLSRLVLAAVFISVGWNKVFKNAEFTADQATQLRSLGVNADPAVPLKVTAAPLSAGEVRFVQASYRQEASPPPTVSPSENPQEDAPQGESSPSSDPQPQDTPAVDASTAPATAPLPTVEPLPEGTYTALSLHKLTLMLHANNFPQPVWMARLAAFTELIGGAMLLLGLFSRIWGLGLAVAMGVAFYLVSMKMNGVLSMDPRTFAENTPNLNAAACQLGLLVLAFGVFLTGPGPLSLDRMLFGGGDGSNVGDGKID